jgi:hypothetical protein
MTSNDLPGFTTQKTPEGIHKFYIHNMKPASVDAWFDTLMAIEKEIIAQDGHMRCLYYLYAWPTPYTIKRVLEASRRAPETLKSSSAIFLVESSGVGVRIIQSLLRQMPVYAMQARQIFFKEADALAWLQIRHASFRLQALTTSEPHDSL